MSRRHRDRLEHRTDHLELSAEYAEFQTHSHARSRADARPDPSDRRAGRRSGEPAGRAAESFRCRNCRLDVPLRAPGTAHRNHCPNCLFSLHLDDRVPGDRASECRARMEPISISVRGAGEWVIIHRCTACDELSANRTAGDDSPLLLLRMATRPPAQPPFPLERLAGPAGL
ncbi:RNHCP domain-containing protein [Streptomyces sp. BE20]|uniref:RNHCP domain-containing protein n=1 Tax=Streptomyces sp. BE20 TaxID=3002525 RepID=UPI002E75F4CC|nr:RNHCP domain-containing protein [Streptomyces sp. BE20]MEE1823845.1 RNHCP domain-containing protein [Streptomyces sp. BE20]